MEKTQIVAALLDIRNKVDNLLESLDEVAEVSEYVVPLKTGDFTIPQGWVDSWSHIYGPTFVAKCIKDACFWSGNIPKGQRKVDAKRFIGNWILRESKKRGNKVQSDTLTGKYGKR